MSEGNDRSDEIIAEIRAFDDEVVVATAAAAGFRLVEHETDVGQSPELLTRERLQDARIFMTDVTITPSNGGPYLVSGAVHLTDVDGREIPHPDHMALCRCGHSNNKPFCDSTHAIIDFDGTLKN